MQYLSYREVYRLGTLCRLFRLVASSVLRIAFRKLVPQIEKEMNKLEANVNSRSNSSGPAMTVEELRQAKLRRNVLRVLLAEARMLKATCWRYIRDDRAKDFCFPCGAVLDKFNRFIDVVRGREIIEHLKTENVTALFPVVEQFFKLFDNTIEPSLITYYAVEATSYGIKVIDILDCCKSSNYSINITHSSGKGPFCLSALYELRHISSFDEAPVLSDDITSEMKMSKICHYLKHNVRWINILSALMEMWSLEDSVDRVQEGLAPPLYDHPAMEFIFQHRESRNMPCNVMEIQHIRENVSGCSRVCYDEFIRHVDVCPPPTHFDMSLDVQLESRTEEQLPLKYECLAKETEDSVPFKINLAGKSEDISMRAKTDQVGENKPAFSLSKQKIIRDEFGWPLMIDEAGKRYDFKLHITTQYPSLIENDVTVKTVICAQQTNSSTFITTSNGIVPYH
jgi:hypothetical protein